MAGGRPAQAPNELFQSQEAEPPHQRGENREQRAEVGLLTHLSEEAIVDEVDHKDLQDKEQGLLLSPASGMWRRALCLLGTQRGSEGGVQWAICGFPMLPLEPQVMKGVGGQGLS